MNLSVDFRYLMLVLLSLGLLGLFLVCLKTLEKATFRCWSTVFRWKYLLKTHNQQINSLFYLIINDAHNVWDIYPSTSKSW